MKKTLLFSMMCLAFLFGFSPRIQAQTVWDGSADISWYDASQLSFDISTPEQLAGVSQLVRTLTTTFSGVTLNLTADLWLNADNDSTNNWIPIGGYPTATSEDAYSTSSYHFDGVFKGHGHKIYNLYCEKSNYFQAGLFGCIKNPCTIDSLALINPVVKSRGMAGALVGYTLDGGNIYISACMVVNARLQGTGDRNHGGLLGANWKMQSGVNWTYIRNCLVTGSLNGRCIGGVVGNGQKVNVTNTYFAGTLSPVLDNSILKYGGLLGHAETGKYSLNNAYSNITTTYNQGVDGIVKTLDYMQTADFVADLGSNFVADVGFNGGFPILGWYRDVVASDNGVCQGESVTLMAAGYSSYLWTPGGDTTQMITVTPDTTTTYIMTGTASDGTTYTHSVTVTVYPQAVVFASVAASADGQVHGTVSPGSATVPCGSSDDVTLTVTPDAGWRVSSVYLNGTQVYGEFTFGPATFTVNPGGTLASVVVNLTDAPTCTRVRNLAISNLYGTNATLSWNAHTTGTLSEYHIVLHNDATNTTTTYTTTNLSYLLLGLMENTPYTVGVYTFCTDGYGSDTVFLHFLTPCNSPVNEVIGNGTETYSYFPTYGYYNYSYTQQVIPASMFLNGEVDYSSIAFQYVYGSDRIRTLSFYMANVPNGTNLSDGWILPSNNIEFKQVYSGYVIFSPEMVDEDMWLEIQLDSAFHYDGTSDVLLSVVDNTGFYESFNNAFRVHDDSTTVNMSRYYHNDGNEINYLNPSNPGNLSSKINNLRFFFCDGNTCMRPNTLTATSVMPTSATVSWVSAGSENAWDVEYKSDFDTDWISYGQVNAPTVTITSLNADTRYSVRVRSVCGAENHSLWSELVVFRTQCAPLTNLPYFNNFDDVISEDGTDFVSCWTRLTTDPNRVVHCYNHAVHSAPYSLDFNYTPACTTAAVTPMIDASIPLNTVMMDFWAYSSLGQGRFEVGVMSDPDDLSTYEFYDTIRLNTPNAWEEILVNFSNYTGHGHYIAILAINGTSTSLIIDDLMLDYVPVCFYPSNLEVVNAVNNSVTLAWNEQGSATAWNIEYGLEGFVHGQGNTVVANSNPFTINGLAAGIPYDFYVQAICGDNTSEWIGPVSATTGQYIMPATGSDTLTTCDMVIYDNGGPNGNYSNNCNFTLVLYPAASGTMMMLTGTASMENNYEHLDIYDGVGTGGTHLASYTGSNQAVNVVSHSGPLTVHFTSDGTVNNYAGFELFSHCVSCYPPFDVTVSEIHASSVNVSWNGSSDSYLVYLYGADTTVISTVDSTLEINNLHANATYAVAVQGMCGADSSLLTIPVSFTTPAVTAILPYITDYENNNDNAQWGFINGTQTNKWYIGTPTNPSSDVNTTPGGNVGLYISNDNGASNLHSSIESRVYAYRDILIPDGVTELKLSFDWKAYGGNARQNFLRVYWIDPTVVTLTAGSNPPTINGVNYDYTAQPVAEHWLSQQNTWQHEEMLISANQFTDLGNGDRVYRLVFHWRNISNTTNPPAAVDNVSLTVVTCTSPMNVSVGNVTDNSATVSWTGNASEYGVTVHSDAGTQIYHTTGTSIALSGLSASTDYQVSVRSYCDGDSSVLSQAVSFTTDCGALTQLPYYNNFDSYIIENGQHYIECWSRLTSDPQHYVNQNAGFHHGNSGGCLDFHITPSCYTMAITPMIDASIPLNTVMVNFWARKNGSVGTFEIGTISDPSDGSTFVVYDTIHFDATSEWEEKEILFNNYVGTAQYIAFRSSNATQTPFVLDDLTISVIPNCWHPSTVEVTSVSGTEATISWNGISDNYVLEYGPAGFAQGSGTTVNVANAMSYTLTGLTPITAYTVYLQSDCGSDGLSSAVSVDFQTTMVPDNLPYTTDFSTNQGWYLNNGSCNNQWKMGVPSGEIQSALFITHDNVTAAYDVNSSTTVMAEKMFNLTSSDSVHVEFDVKVGGESTWDYLKVFLTPSTEVFTAGSGQNTQSPYTYGTYAVDFSQYTVSSNHYILNMTNEVTVHISVNLPNPAVNGQGKLVFLWRNDSNLGTQPGAIVSNLSVSAIGSGPVVTNPTVATVVPTTVTQTSATLNATITNPSNVNITAKGFEWKATDGGVYTQIPGSGASNIFSANLTGLAANTSYTYRAYISFNGINAYGAEITFNTLEEGACAMPTGLTVMNIAGESITLSWDADDNVDSWRIQYCPMGGNPSSATSTTNSYTLTGLMPMTTYQIQIQADCGDGSVSEWSPVIFVSTTVGIAEHLANSVNLYPNPANDYVNVQCTTNDVQVEGVEVIDVYGKVVRTVETFHETSLQTTQINVSGLADGMYFVRLITDKGMITKPFVKK